MRDVHTMGFYEQHRFIVEQTQVESKQRKEEDNRFGEEYMYEPRSRSMKASCTRYHDSALVGGV